MLKLRTKNSILPHFIRLYNSPYSNFFIKFKNYFLTLIYRFSKIFILRIHKHSEALTSFKIFLNFNILLPYFPLWYILPKDGCL